MEIVIIILCALIIGILLFMLFRKQATSASVDKEEIRKAVDESINAMAALLLSSIENTNKLFSGSVGDKIGELKEGTKERLDQIDKSISRALSEIRRENTEKLGEIQRAVDEKLQKTLDERLKSSFDNVVSQIGNVNKAIGEIKNIAADVGSLKNVLTNVKTKGIVGEVILGNIISEILTNDQYEENFATKKGSRDVVEFAIKMPAGAQGEYVYLPVDSKFPLEIYYKIKDAIDKGSKDELDMARKELRNKLRTYAKDVATKYISVPDTTDFAIMFLPIEGLYVEAIEGGLFEEFQREFKVNIVGPSTLAALLNALRSGFNSLAIQKRSNEVFKLLEAVKAEFESFAKVLSGAQQRADQLSDELEKLVGTRTRQMQKKLKDISIISLEEAKQIIDEE
ncbi:MAG: DNA recombination protein RmuC [Clostridia bacterium]|nr:DNA recombination protein RmuC [Clostridia bacterium]